MQCSSITRDGIVKKKQKALLEGLAMTPSHDSSDFHQASAPERAIHRRVCSEESPGKAGSIKYSSEQRKIPDLDGPR